LQNLPHNTSPAMSCTLCFHRPPSASSQNFALRILDAMDSASFVVSSLPIAAKTRRPFPMLEINWPSIVTEADLTRWMTAVVYQMKLRHTARKNTYSSYRRNVGGGGIASQHLRSINPPRRPLCSLGALHTLDAGVKGAVCYWQDDHGLEASPT
jgi:hypothetical protein